LDTTTTPEKHTCPGGRCQGNAGAGLQGCLSSKNSQQKTARNNEDADRFSSEMFFLLLYC
jgi:hypothetical protein